MKDEILRLRRKVQALEKARYRQKTKIKSPQRTPKSSMQRLCKKYKIISSPVKRRLFESFALEAELRDSCTNIKSFKEKQIMARLVSGRVLKHYRLLRSCSLRGLFSLRHMRNGRKDRDIVTSRLEYRWKTSGKRESVRREIRDFFLGDEASTECPGIKQGKT